MMNSHINRKIRVNSCNNYDKNGIFSKCSLNNIKSII